MVGTVYDECNDYFVTRYWALKKVTITSIFLLDKTNRSPLFVTNDPDYQKTDDR
jgi:hypothetical protein